MGGAGTGSGIEAAAPTWTLWVVCCATFMLTLDVTIFGKLGVASRRELDPRALDG